MALNQNNYPAPDRDSGDGGSSRTDREDPFYRNNADYEYQNGRWRNLSVTNDDDLYRNYTRRGIKLSLEDFRDRFGGSIGGAELEREYSFYENSFEINQQNRMQSDETALADTYWEDQQRFMEAQPGYEAMSEFIPDYLNNLTNLQDGSMEMYPGQLSIGADPQMGQMTNYLGGQMFEGGIDRAYDGIAEAYKDAKDDFLPAMRQNWEETSRKPAEERLEMLGLSGSTPGMSMMSDMGESYAIEEAAAGREMDMMYADKMGMVEGARRDEWARSSGILSQLIGMNQNREGVNIGREYQDWMTHQNDQYTRLGLAGNAMSTSAGALSSMAGQGIQAASIPYEQGSAWDMMNAENSFMAPHYEAMSQPVSSGGGGGKK